MANALVFIDNPGAALKKSSLELLTIARSLGETAVAFTGELSDDVAATLGAYGATTVYRPSTDDLDNYLVGPKAAYLAAAAAASGATAVLLDNSPEGKEIAARLGIKLNAGVITDVVGVEPDGTAHKSVLAGSYNTSAKATTSVTVLSVKANNVEPAPAGAAAAPATATVDVPGDAVANAARISARAEKPVSGRPDLSEARIVVAGGRGVDGDFGPLEELADALGAAVGASRAATDAGWIGHDAQVGQTGVTVSPQLYISAGISGAIQQKAGMQTSKVIVAVNKDAESPVFEIADYGIIGDLFKVIPQATAEIKKRKG
ncbi:electron transfer flavoprotein subunit alpha/FixB family protein [Paenarthrobacter nicotinovorans]|jgi:electron transfer flavoprotein alpha subunit|uniref:electron transfer flavoprotein subunit alpha/FixB family protein n=1 Tax=Paenarthrobacter nicotinovorans TaxID=29320 RepID=UPI00070129DD|nr:electron transfer flavoprotein subunit alpha/FixB family protein [Paenarthrobacter nicotinovorans]KQR06367.1 electron transfer flavoprotein subunit alpha [Arthrobacter sp. Leaf145]MBP2395993.1 electron transfer flavoprotein alpha subunit [Paenarthrobacter nicotinovorans]UKE97914.1 electron transfer flavoprotein subunit alpha/FixB family protein [Paenarthrobacter nicotinovorans]UKF02700.1 electron transfer flavoprotein subunit alpha/FixB family protein [Paenarthrobacter nicotinovorans]GGV208